MSDRGAKGSVVLERGPCVLWRRVAEWLVVLPPDGDAQRLAGSGPVLWELLARPVAYHDLLDGLAAFYGEPAARIDADLVPVLAELEALGVIRTVPDPSAS